jgi:hypothetical protein
MKSINVTIPSCVKRALAGRYDVSKLQSALDADYNNDGRKDNDDDKLAVNTVEAGIKTAKATEGKTDGAKGSFKSTDVHKIERAGALNDPRRMITWLLAFGKFIKTNGEPSGELTPEVLPCNLVFWLERKFVLKEIAEKEKAKNGSKPALSGKRHNGSVAPTVAAPEAPAAS